MKKYLIILLVAVLSACSVVEVFVGDYHKMVATNDCSTRIDITAYADGVLIDSISIEPEASFDRTIENRFFSDNPSIFSKPTVDSIQVRNGIDQIITYYCQGDELLASLDECQDLKNTIAGIGYSDSRSEIRKFENGDSIRYKYLVEFSDSDFN